MEVENFFQNFRAYSCAYLPHIYTLTVQVLHTCGHVHSILLALYYEMMSVCALVGGVTSPGQQKENGGGKDWEGAGQPAGKCY